MKTIGLLGGMSWESTSTYYRLINQETNRRLGGLHSARLVLLSVDFDEVEALQRSADWTGAAEVLGRGAESLERAGAELLLICTNTMHIVAGEIAARVGMPLLHIADPTGDALNAAGIHRAGLLGTRFTMEEPFYREHLMRVHRLDVITPPEEERVLVHRIIYEELCLGRVSTRSRARYLEIIDRLRKRGAEAVILGCTEIALLVRPSDTEVKLFDTTALHACAAVDLALA